MTTFSEQLRRGLQASMELNRQLVTTMAKAVPTWQDTTSYYVNESPKVPRNFELRLGDDAVVRVHARASKYAYARTWKASAGKVLIIRPTELKATTETEAKREALSAVVKSLEKMLAIAKHNLESLES